MEPSFKPSSGRLWPSAKRFRSMVDQFLTNGFPEGFSISAMKHHEDDKNYYLELITPGVKKEELKLRLNDCILTVYTDQQAKEEKPRKSTHKTFCERIFNRSFIVPGNININAIRAIFTEGVLNITLPKRNSHARFEPRDLLVE